MHKKIKELAGNQSCSNSGCLKTKDGTVILEKEKILEGWKNYIQELFHEDRGEKPLIKKNMEGPLILKSEVRAAVAKMRKNKAAGQDEIMTEMIMALDALRLQPLLTKTEEIRKCFTNFEISLLYYLKFVALDNCVYSKIKYGFIVNIRSDCVFLLPQ